MVPRSHNQQGRNPKRPYGSTAIIKKESLNVTRQIETFRRDLMVFFMNYICSYWVPLPTQWVPLPTRWCVHQFKELSEWPQPSLDLRLSAAVWPQPSIDLRLGAAVWPQPSIDQRLSAAVWPQPSIDLRLGAAECLLAAVWPQPRRPSRPRDR